jgi:hypothetical protein
MLPALIVPVGLAVFGYLIMRAFVFNVVDEVYLNENEIIVRNSGEEDRFSVSNVLSVYRDVMINGEPITLTLREPSKFGREIVFSHPGGCGRSRRTGLPTS